MEFLIINNRIEQNFQSFQNLRRRKLLTFDVSYPLASKPNLSPSRRYDRVKRVGGGEDTRKTALAGLRWGCVQDKERAGSKSRLLSWLTRIVRQHCSPLFDYRAFVYTIQPRGFLLSNRSRVIRLCRWKKEGGRGWRWARLSSVRENPWQPCVTGDLRISLVKGCPSKKLSSGWAGWDTLLLLPSVNRGRKS